MKRDVANALEKWAKKATRVPLVIRGARQVGKSWLVKSFGKSFPFYIELNFEKQKTLKTLFQGDIHIAALLEKLQLYLNTPIVPGKTLLFLDEIQECPEAILYLRYFKEECPALHIVAAGSLIEFALEKVGMPVGRVEYLYVYPLSFGEFLSVSGREDLRVNVQQAVNTPILSSLLEDMLKTYLWLGGMPEVVQTWLTTQSVTDCQNVQDRLITAYQDDFPKYAKKHQITHVDKVFNRLPQQFGKKFVYTHIDADIKAAILKQALFCLEKAGVAHLCHYSASYHLPLAAGSSEKFFKVFFLDVGLAQRLLKFKTQEWIAHSLKPEHLGGLAEQFVAQELIAYQSQLTQIELFYWQREAKNSQAEIDFLIGMNGNIIPIEVKSGKGGHLKSLHYYLNTHPDIPFGVKISQANWQKQERVQEIPFYGIEAWLRQNSVK